MTAVGVEALGHENHVLFAAPHDTHDTSPQLCTGLDGEEATPHWTAKVDAHCPVTLGEVITFGVDLTAAHFFDPESHLAIPVRTELPEGPVVPAALV